MITGDQLDWINEVVCKREVGNIQKPTEKDQKAKETAEQARRVAPRKKLNV